MVDIVDTPAVDTPAVDTPVVDAPTPELFGEDGNFTENWTHTLKNEALHDDPTLKTIRNMDALASVTVNTKSMVGKNTIAIPTDASTELEWEEYHKAGGRPETAADYNLTRPEDLPEEHWNQDYANGIQDILFKFGGSERLAGALFEFDNNFKATLRAQRIQDEELATTELKNGLYTEWGNAYEQRLHLGNIAIEQGVSKVVNDATVVDEELKARVIKKYGNDPDLIRVLSNLGSKFIEHGLADTSKLIPTPSDLQSQIDEIQANPLYLSGTQEQRMKLANQVMALREKIKPTAKTT